VSGEAFGIPNDVAPADFDLNAWIDGSKPTVRSCTITGRGDLVAEAEDLLRRYEKAKDVKDGDRGMGDDSPDALLAQMEQLEDELDASRTIWHLRALTSEEIKAAGEAAEKAKPDDEETADYTAHQIAAAVVRVETPDGKVSASVTAEQVLALRARLGEREAIKLFKTLERAMSEEPMITAPFSRTSSPDRAGLG
jgi:hypothetical protein